MTPDKVIEFWFAEDTRKRWFHSTLAFDREITTRFEDCWHRARNGQLEDWELTVSGALALVIVLDQLPLNMFRDQPKSFSTEAQSREVAARAIEKGLNTSLPDDQKAFLYLPYMHSESLADQDRSVELFATAGLTDNLKWARSHREIIRRFGRFPHRNAILGRASSAEEIEWLQSPDAFNP